MNSIIEIVITRRVGDTDAPPLLRGNSPKSIVEFTLHTSLQAKKEVPYFLPLSPHRTVHRTDAGGIIFTPPSGEYR
jgi:hypothetical protein